MMNEIGEFLDQYGLHIDVQSRYIDFISEAGQLGTAILSSTDYGTHPVEATEEFKDEAGDCLFSLIALIQESRLNSDDVLAEVVERYRKRMMEYPG